MADCPFQKIFSISGLKLVSLLDVLHKITKLKLPFCVVDASVVPVPGYLPSCHQVNGLTSHPQAYLVLAVDGVTIVFIAPGVRIVLPDKPSTLIRNFAIS